MNELSTLMILAFIVFASPFVAKLIRIPISPTEILLGMCFGSLGFLGDNQLFKIVSDVGFYYLMFLAGTEVDLKIFINTDKNILKKSLIFTFTTYALASIITYVFGLSPLFIIVIPLISIGILSTLYKDYGKKQDWLNMAMLVGVIGEVVSIALLTILSAYLKHGFGSALVFHLLVLIGFLVAVTFLFKGLELLFWWYPSIKTVLMPKYDKDEKDIRLSMALFCFVIAIMILIDLKVVLGAFIAGTFIATFFDHKKELPHKLSSFGFGFLVPIFFAYVGASVDVKSILNLDIIYQVLMLTVATIAVRFFASLVFVKTLGIKQTILFAFSLSMPLTLLIAVATIGFETGHISKQTYIVFIVSSLFQAIFCLVMVKLIHSTKKSKNDTN